MSFITLATAASCLLAVTLARPDPRPANVFGNFNNFTKQFQQQKERNEQHFGDFFNGVGKGINREVADVKQPFERVIVDVASSQCSLAKQVLGLNYDQLKSGREPNLSDLTIEFITPAYNISYNIEYAAQSIPESKDFHPNETLYIFIHGFTDDPFSKTFGNVRRALFSQGNSNVMALDGSSLIKWLYLRSSTYVHFIGNKLGEVLAAMVKYGVDPANIHVIGHSLGAHISGFTGKAFTNLTGESIGRITGLDPAGPCYTNVDKEDRLKSTDANFVDVIHTDGGVLGLTDPIGHVDYYPNSGAQQPQCLLQSCSHRRSWWYFSESVVNPQAFPAIQCDSWKQFEKGSCEGDISYMGFPSQPGTTGNYYLQTNGEQPFGRGMNGTSYRDNDGVIKNITQVILPIGQ